MGRDNALENLHPEFRTRATELVNKLSADDLPFRLFEGWRSPQRQTQLYAQGRSAPGGKVTFSRAWQSYHQYGLAADFVLYVDGEWSWKTDGRFKKMWARLHELAGTVDLEPLSFEKPHVQLRGLQISKLMLGQYPGGGDPSWAENLGVAIQGWSGSPNSPPIPREAPQRPALAHEETEVAGERRFEATHQVIARAGLRLRAGPGTQNDIIGRLEPGQRIRVLSTIGDWSLVDLQGDGLADGYCSHGFLQPTG
jgi:Bacterial SH3 domain/D-alanyl-D-alanine carboxypeptidase